MFDVKDFVKIQLSDPNNYWSATVTPNEVVRCRCMLVHRSNVSGVGYAYSYITNEAIDNHADYVKATQKNMKDVSLLMMIEGGRGLPGVGYQTETDKYGRLFFVDVIPDE